MMDIIEAANSTLKFVLLTFPVILLASFATSQLIERDLIEKFSEHIKPLLKRLNLSEITVSSVAVCFVSATAAYSILSQALREKVIDERGYSRLFYKFVSLHANAFLPLFHTIRNTRFGLGRPNLCGFEADGCGSKVSNRACHCENLEYQREK